MNIFIHPDIIQPFLLFFFFVPFFFLFFESSKTTTLLSQGRKRREMIDLDLHRYQFSLHECQTAPPLSTNYFTASLIHEENAVDESKYSFAYTSYIIFSSAFSDNFLMIS
ncbi:hypothetical protein ACMFMG_005934 [Clarireedia jacksonii]